LQLTTDGHRAYLSAVEDAFGAEIDYAMLQKIYGNSEQGPETRYSPAVCMGARKAIIKRKSRLQARFDQLCGAPESHDAHVDAPIHAADQRIFKEAGKPRALYSMHYNFCRIHQSLHVTPAMEAGVSDHVWSLEEIIGLLKSVS
jgi:hypothetical protein